MNRNPENRIVMPPRSDAPPFNALTAIRGAHGIPFNPISEDIQAWRDGDANPLLSGDFFSNNERVGSSALKYLGLWLDRTAAPHVWVEHDAMTLTEKDTMFDTIHPSVATALNTSEPIKPVKQ